MSSTYAWIAGVAVLAAVAVIAVALWALVIVPVLWIAGAL